jgi:polysaccharide biosynthesis/export protein
VGKSVKGYTGKKGLAGMAVLQQRRFSAAKGFQEYYNRPRGGIITMKYILTITSILFMSFLFSAVWAQSSQEPKVVEKADFVEIYLPSTPSPEATVQEPQTAESPASPMPVPIANYQASQTSSAPRGRVKFDPMQFTLGPEDVVEITVMRHPEFSGVYPINQEGKLQYKFVGDFDVTGLTKVQLEEKLRSILSTYVIAPEVSVTVTEYRSKVFYVVGEVNAPGKYYMRSETIPIREAIFEAGLPTSGAAMRKCQIITPGAKTKPVVRKVDLYSILYRGNLNNNLLLKPGDILYVPSTVMAKLIKVISPPAEVVGVAASGPDSASTGKTASETLRGRPL